MTPPSEMERLSRALATATDDRIRKAVAMVDALPERGAAEGLVAPLRPRLARMRLPRAVNFTRLLFLPLDPVIVSRADWRANGPGIPRSALAVLARIARQAWPWEEQGVLDDADMRLATLTTGDVEEIHAIGGRIWPVAAACLPSIAPPDDWAEATGLAVEDFAPIAGTLSLVLAHGLSVMRLRQAAGDLATLEADVAALCGAALATLAGPDGKLGKARSLETIEGKAALATLVATLMMRSPRADRVLAIAERLGGGDKHQLAAVQSALAFALGRMVALATEGTLAHAANAIGWAAATLADLDALLEVRPAPRQHLEDARGTIDAACRARLAAGFAELVAAIRATPADPAELEALTRDIRQFERAARQIGGAEIYDRVVGDVVAHLSGTTEAGEAAIESARVAAMLLQPVTMTT